MTVPDEAPKLKAASIAALKPLNCKLSMNREKLGKIRESIVRTGRRVTDAALISVTDKAIDCYF